MTPEERAEKIYKIVAVDAEYDQSMLDQIAAQIREAIEEARQDGTFRGGYHLVDLQKAYKRGKEEGFNAAKEKAAEIVEKEIVTVWDIKAVADRIREAEMRDCGQ